MSLFKRQSRVRVAPSNESIKKIEEAVSALNSMQPILPSQKSQTREELLEKQRQILSYSPWRPGYSVGQVADAPQKVAGHKTNLKKTPHQIQR